MGRDWSKQRRREATVRARTARLDEARYLNEIEDHAPQVSKAELRAQADALVAAFNGRVKRLPTYAALRCRTCGHRGNARVPIGKAPRFRCSACGSSLVAWRV